MTAPASHPTAVELLPEPLMVVDEGGVVLDTNTALLNFLGKKREQVVGSSLAALVVEPENKVTDYLAAWSRVGQLVPGSLTFSSSDGVVLKTKVEGGRIGRRIGSSERPCLVRLTPAAHASSSFIELNDRLNRLHTEISERRRVQQELERSQQELQRSHEELEQRVQDRTRELLAVTQQLQSEIEQRTRAEERLRALSGRLLNLRDEERRRLARELHDSIGQLLAALQLNLALTQSTLLPEQTQAAARITECTGLADQAIREVRTISYLLHPPMLDEAGRVLALQWYVDGFVERSRIKIKLELPPTLARLPQEVETAVFRIAQEALTNIHRHSGSTEGTVTLGVTPDQLSLVITDQGRGIPAEKMEDRQNGHGSFGVGIRGMRERVKQLGGRLDISTANPGTRIAVAIPLAKEKAQQAAQPQTV